MDYGSAWAGAWNQKWGWSGVEQDLQDAFAAGVTPVIHWWYWGDDITPTCVENGCTDRYHGVLKDKATWTRLSIDLAALILRAVGPGARAIVVLETEFNKNGIETYEPFDGYLAEQTAIFKNAGHQVVLGFGGWGFAHWGTFDRAVAADDMLGTTALRSSLRDATTYHAVADDLVASAQYFRTRFNKPTFVTDLGLSSYPAPEYEAYQAAVINEVFERLDELQSWGVVGIVFRMLADDPASDMNNYHGIAERHWGFLRADGSAKPVLAVWQTRATAPGATPVIPPGPTHPFGIFDTPIHNATVSGSLAVTGWALDDVGIDRVEIWRDLVANDPAVPFREDGHPADNKVFTANGTFVEGTRPDVEGIYTTMPARNRAGWRYLLLTQGFPNANGTFVLTAIAWDTDGAANVLGSKTILVNNAASTKPFGSIDVPAYGATFSGHQFTYGWALTPNGGCTMSGGQVYMTIIPHRQTSRWRTGAIGLTSRPRSVASRIPTGLVVRLRSTRSTTATASIKSGGWRTTRAETGKALGLDFSPL